MPTLRWGILGVAGINRRLLPAFKASTTAELVAIASRSKEKAAAAADAAGIPAAHGSYEALLADPQVQAVYVPLPNHLHAEWTRKAADAGKHVLCEKPLTPDAASAAEVVAYCRAKGVRLLDGFMWPHHPRTKQLKAFLDGGGIGRVRAVNAAFTFTLTGLPTSNIRMQPEAAGGGLLDVGCYPVYAIRHFLGAEPVEAYATATFVNGVDVALAGVLTFADGITAHFDCGFTRPLRTWVEVVGTEAVVRVPNLWIPDERAAYEVHRQSREFGHSVETVETPGHDQMVCMIDELAFAVAETREAVPNPSEAVNTLRVLDAVARSARERRPVAV
jgi:predicted dehydrogenase